MVRPPRSADYRDRALRWIVRRGPFIACVALTGLFIVTKIVPLMIGLLGWSVAPEGLRALLAELDRMPWPVAMFSVLAAWMIFLLGVPLWQRYLAYRNRAAPSQEPQEHSCDIDARTALLYAIHGTWPLAVRGERSGRPEPERVARVLSEFHELAKNGLIDVWGRTGGMMRPLEPIDPDHWRYFEVPLSELLKESNEPINAVLRGEHHAEEFAKRDLHLNFAQVRHFWPEAVGDDEPVTRSPAVRWTYSGWQGRPH